MRYCPTCETKFEEDKIRFCTKDGTELVEGSIPSFTDNLPSDSVPVEDDPGEETIIRRKRPAAPSVSELPEEFDEVEEDQAASRIVIDTAERTKERLRTQPPAGLVPPPQRTGPGTGVIIFFSVLGTLIVVIGIFAIYLLLTMRAGDANSNVNENINANENLDQNFNSDDLFNLNANLDSNSNLNTNVNTATPTPSPSPSPTETPETNVNGNVNSNISPGQSPASTPSPRPTVTATPSPANVPSNTNRPVNIGTINSRAVSLPLPSYPSSARQVRAAGRVAVAVTLDRDGNVVSATATSGHPLLRGAAEDAALRSRFRPVSVNGRTVPARGTILYNFVD
ncbi:MAG: TonB family protein [Aridibacter famidurans]|nr:TonB family protein [Aridibacter famidurans]